MENLNYGIIGNCKSAALVSEKGSIDWLCLPKFDAPSVFAKLLDENKGGALSIEPKNLLSIGQEYIDRTNLLCTRFICEEGVFEVIDFMPRYKTTQGSAYAPPDVIRVFNRISGAPVFKVKYQPKLEYGLHPTELSVHSKFIKGVTKKGAYDSLYLYSDFDFKDITESNEITLTSSKFILVSYNQKLLKQDIHRVKLQMERTKVYWLNWSERTTTFSKYNDEINRSALTLKLLSYQKTGAVLAALTTSLPETIGEVRNWDYRYCWIRDGSMVVKILNQVNHKTVAKNYLNFIINILPEKDEKMQIMYGISGEKKLSEYELPHFSGYADSKPVRVGNAAYKQKQNDIYGILMDAIYQHFSLYSATLDFSEDLWTVVRNVVKMVERNWKKPDKGIWEIRGESKHFTFSKVLCWVAIDRAQKIAALLEQESYMKKWKQLEDKIREDIENNAWSEEKQSYTQAYGSEDLDASVLLMESYGYIDGKNERYRSTVYAIQKELEHEGLMYRYANHDDFGLPKSAFTICAFWLVNALYKIGEKEAAIERFEKLLVYSNHLGLYSEDLDFETKRQLGNFPQAYSHLALIETAINISEGEVSKEEKIKSAIS
ncbi:glycoside hydrolase family 15 protein [Plebeiibacterium sediminum]|uniref:Glycoside hydrolase family 15 protein n=1 Tax=Plebeiibacterium sediminum TaxID=2992112 RepID=A0AAE3M2N5_9BACT|nr:glycoside hydrolase family 15 protein [Plebeiobacterium sediminum]MCW3786014.1 glycoside hydrolase family 15 protein [Plebeiobacterium sediminum]